MFQATFFRLRFHSQDAFDIFFLDWLVCMSYVRQSDKSTSIWTRTFRAEDVKRDGFAGNFSLRRRLGPGRGRSFSSGRKRINRGS